MASEKCDKQVCLLCFKNQYFNADLIAISQPSQAWLVCANYHGKFKLDNTRVQHFFYNIYTCSFQMHEFLNNNV